jgi:ankyrin repeat protein
MPTAFEIAIRKNNAKLVDTFLSDKWLLPVDIRNKKSQTGLMIACCFKAKKTAKVLINRNAELDARDTRGWTALHHAAYNGSLDCVKLLTEHKIDIKAKANDGQTPLHLACTNWKNLKLIQFLIEEQKVDPNITCNEGKTVLHYAAESGPEYRLRYLIEDQKLDIEATDNKGRTALHLAFQPNHIVFFRGESEKYLLEEHPKIIAAKDKSGKTALHYCLEYFEEKNCFSNFQPAALILAAKAQSLKKEENNYNDYIFDWIKKGYDSCKHESKDITEEEIKCLNVGFLAYQKQLNMLKNFVGERKFDPNPLLGIVAKCNRVDIAAYMFNQDLLYFEKQHFNAKDANKGRTLLLESYLDFSCVAGWLDLVTFLFQEINKKPEYFHNWSIDVSFLEYACISKNFEVFKFLFEEKEKEIGRDLIEAKLANINTKYDEGETLLNYALRRGPIEIIKYLIEEKKACFDTSYEDGRNVLQLVCSSVFESSAVIKYISQKAKLDVNAQDEDGSTALHLACNTNNLRAVKVLINDNRTNLHSVDKEGRTPLHVACLPINPIGQIAKLLISKGANVLAKDKSGKSPLQMAIRELGLVKIESSIIANKAKLVIFLEAATKR